MRNSFKVASLAAVISTLMGGAAMAAETFPSWAKVGQTTGDDNKSIPAADIVAKSDDYKFVQFRMKGDDGLTYIVTRIVDNRVPQGQEFDDLSMVRMSPQNESATVEGIRTKQHIKSLGQGNQGTFTSDTSIESGWGQVANERPGITLNGGTLVKINQGIDFAGTTVNGVANAKFDNFKSDFVYESQSNTGTGGFLGASLEITQKNGLGTANSKSAFLLRDKQGAAYVNNANGQPTSVTIASSSSSVGNQNPGTVTWSTGEQVKGIWLGQDIVTDAISTQMGFVSFEARDSNGNVKTGSPIFQVAIDDSTKSNAAWVWDTTNGTGVLGAKPCMSDPSGATCAP